MYYFCVRIHQQHETKNKEKSYKKSVFIGKRHDDAIKQPKEIAIFPRIFFTFSFRMLVSTDI